MQQDELNLDEAYETERGTPTLSFLIGKSQYMLPYHSFEKGRYVPSENASSNITLKFGEGKLIIQGSELAALWADLQLQDVRYLEPKDNASEGEVAISLIRWEIDEG